MDAVKTQQDDCAGLMARIGKAARLAAAELAFASAERKYAALIGAAEAVWNARDEIIAANALDMAFAREKGLSPAMLDRLMLDEGRIRGIVKRPARYCRTARPGGRGDGRMGPPHGATHPARAHPFGRGRRDL